MVGLVSPAEFADGAQRVPFVEFGRDRSGWDCWGLLCVAYEEVHGVLLPRFDGEYSSTRRRDELRDLIAKHRELQCAWSRVQDPRPGDAVLLKMLGRPCHVGFMINEHDVLHAEAYVGTHVERVDRPPWRDKSYNKVEGFYRHEYARQW